MFECNWICALQFAPVGCTYCNSLQWLYHNPLDLVEQLVGHLLSPCAFQVESKVTDRPLTPMYMIVIILKHPMELYTCKHTQASNSEILFLIKNIPTPCFWMATLVRWTNMLSSSLVLGVYFTVQNRQNPNLYLKIKIQIYMGILTYHLQNVSKIHWYPQILWPISLYFNHSITDPGLFILQDISTSFISCEHNHWGFNWCVCHRYRCSILV